MREMVTKRAQIWAATMLIVIAIAGVILMIAMSFALLPLALYRRMSLLHSPWSKVKIQGPGMERRFSKIETSSIMHHGV